MSVTYSPISRAVAGIEERASARPGPSFGHACAVLARLFAYPSNRLIGDALAARELLRDAHPEAAEALGDFLAWTLNESLGVQEEVHTRTFSISPVCVPYVSVHIFGDESFARGALMARLREEFERRGYDPGPELPDHLAVLLGFVDRLDAEEVAELVEYCLEKPVAKLAEQMAATENPYRHLIAAVHAIVRRYA